jgi:hypothetical protein
MAKTQAATVATGAIRVTMTQDKVTKNAVRYKEDHEREDQADLVGQLYLQKAAFPNGAPQKIAVAVQAL